MKSMSRWMVLAVLLICGNALAVRMGDQGRGQVLLFPQFAAINGFDTTLDIRNTETELAKAVRVVFKDPVNGRPTLAVNVYLLPGDSWSATVREGDPEVEGRQVGVLMPWTDDSCTFPTRDSIPVSGLALSDSQLDDSFGDIELPDRLTTGSVEIYEMGRLIPEIAGDCAAINRRFVANTGAWHDDDAQALRNRGMRPPSGGLQATLALVDGLQGMGFHVDALALDEFTDQALHTHPDNGRVPSLNDVSPASSSVLESRVVNGVMQRVERVSDWDVPIHAVDAVLMTELVSANYVSERSNQVFSFAILSTPTAPYHNDVDGYYLTGPAERVSAPFTEEAALGAGLDTVGASFDAIALNGDGDSFELRAPGGNDQCQELRGPTTAVTLTNIISFTHTCDVGDAELRIPDNATRGEVTLSFAGQITSVQGDVYDGLPVFGYMMQAYRNRTERLPGNVIRTSAFGWSQPLRREGGLSQD